MSVSSERYERGLADFLNVLDAARQEYALETQLATEQAAVAIQYIALYKALGGGWEIYQDLPPFPNPSPRSWPRSDGSRTDGIDGHQAGGHSRP